MEGICSQEEFEKYKIQHNKDILNRPSNLSDLSIEEQAKWADPITKKYVLDEKFIELMTSQLENGHLYGLAYYFNLTSVSNAAYLALHSNYKEKFLKIHSDVLEEYRADEDGSSSGICIIL